MACLLQGKRQRIDECAELEEMTQILKFNHNWQNINGETAHLYLTEPRWQTILV